MRAFRKGARRGGMMRRMANGALINEVQQELARANQLLDNGRYDEAATIFSDVSEQAERHQFLGRAGKLAARASHAYLQAGDVKKSIVSSLRAIELVAVSRDSKQAVPLAHRLLAEYSVKGVDQEESNLRNKISTILARHGLSLGTDQQIPQGSNLRVPAQCPSCLAPVRSDEVERPDSHSAVCAYCGSILQTS